MSLSVKVIKGHRYLYVEVPSDSGHSNHWVSVYVGKDTPENRLRALEIRLAHLKERKAHYESLIQACQAEIGELTKISVNRRRKK